MKIAQDVRKYACGSRSVRSYQLSIFPCPRVPGTTILRFTMKKQIAIPRLMASTIRACAVTCALLISALLMTLAGCGGGGSGNPHLKSISFDPTVDVFAQPAESGSSARTFECTSKNADGTCNVNVCKQGPGGATFDCASFAAACVDAGQHWSGTKEGGKCTRVL
jgi:hypothetical protein